MCLHKQYAFCPAEFVLFFGPDAGLHFAYMRFLKQIHTQATLSDTATYRVWQFAVDKRLMEVELQTVLATASRKLCL